MADNEAPGTWPIWTPGSRLAGIIKGLLKLLHTNYKSSGPLGFREKNFFTCFPIISLWRPMTHLGRVQLGPEGHDWHFLWRVHYCRLLAHCISQWYTTIFYWQTGYPFGTLPSPIGVLTISMVHSYLLLSQCISLWYTPLSY